MSCVPILCISEKHNYNRVVRKDTGLEVICRAELLPDIEKKTFFTCIF